MIAPMSSSTPTTPSELLAHLESLGIRTRTIRHPPVFTVDEAKALRGNLPGGHIKNLFLRNKKGDMWLVVADEDRSIDLRDLGARLGAGRLSFGSPERLMTHLGIAPGAVTPFALINDRGCLVRAVIDKTLLDHGTIHCHPLTNDMTTAIAPADLMAFIRSSGHQPLILDFAAGGA
jgi:Ala-tRNA(Pro) deacylase